MVIEDEDSNPTDAADAARWRDTLGITFTVLADPEHAWVDDWGRNGDRHTYSVVGEDGVVLIHIIGQKSDTDLALIEAATAP